MRKILAAIPLAALTGCMSLGNLDQYPVRYSGDLKGNYYDLAECSKARQTKLVPMVRIELLHDKPAKEAVVSWNHEFGMLNAFIFKGVDQDHTKLTVYTAGSMNDSWIELTKGCQESPPAAS